MLESISKEIINALLNADFTKWGELYVPSKVILKIGNNDFDLSQFIIVKGENFSILEPLVMTGLSSPRFYQIWIKAHFEPTRDIFLEESFYQMMPMTYDPNYFYRNKLDQYYNDEYRLNRWFGLGSKSDFERGDVYSKTYIQRGKMEYMSDRNRLRNYYLTTVDRENVSKDWMVLKKKESQVEAADTNKKVKEFVPPNTSLNLKALSESYLLIIERLSKNGVGSSFFLDSWIKYLGNNWLIPIDKTKRPPKLV